MLAGGGLGGVSDDDRRFVVDLGLVKRAEGGGLEIANPIYREVIVRSLARGLQDSLPRLLVRHIIISQYPLAAQVSFDELFVMGGQRQPSAGPSTRRHPAAFAVFAARRADTD